MAAISAAWFLTAVARRSKRSEFRLQPRRSAWSSAIAIDSFFAILYSVLDARAYAIAIGLNLVNAALWAVTPLFHRWPGPLPEPGSLAC